MASGDRPGPGYRRTVIRDLTDAEARAALVKWSGVPDGTIPAWVAEMDFAPAPVVLDAVHDAVARGRTGYSHTFPTDAPGDGSDTDAVASAYATFAERHWGWTTPGTRASTLVVDVTAGLRLAVAHLVPDGPIVLPTPCYPPFRALLALAGRQVVELPVPPDDPGVALDLDRLEAALADGARGLLLCSPHNPLGRVWRRDELQDVADLAGRYGARVVADEVHAPLTLPGASFTPYLGVDPTGIAVTSASKAFNVPGLHCALVQSLDPTDADVLRALPTAANLGPSRLGVAAAAAAFRHGDAWLAAVVDRIDAQRTLLAELLARHLPGAVVRPLEATYLAWVDLRAYGVEDPAAAARQHGAQPAAGHGFAPELTGHVRLNLATTPERLEQLVVRIARGLGAA